MTTHPANLRRQVFDRLASARGAGDRTAYEAAQADLVKVNKYEAEYLGIPAQYVDQTTGRWDIPENICRKCWQAIAGPVFALGVGGSCQHFHPDCRPDSRPLDIPYPAGWQHPRRSCHSQLPYYAG